VVDDLKGARKKALVNQGGQLCLAVDPDTDRAVVAVFADDQALEGCSRLTRPEQPEALLTFHEFDNCRWQTSPRGFD